MDPDILERGRDRGMDDARIIREDDDAWGLASGEIDRNVSGKVNAQELSMIQLFHRDACAPVCLLGPAGTPRSNSLEESGEQGHRVIVLSSWPFRPEGVRRDASLEPMEEPSWFGTIRMCDSIRGPDHNVEVQAASFACLSVDS
jgi:hypothetical protein